MTSDHRNLLNAVLISVAILLCFHYFYELPRQERLKQIAATEQAENGGNQQVTGTRGDSPSAQLSAIPETPVRDRVVVLADSSRIKIDNPRLYGSIARTGIRFDDLAFTDYFTAIDHKAHVDLLSPGGTEAPYYAAFSWVSDDPSVALPDDKTKWTGQDQPLTPGQPLVLTWNNGQGLVFQRTIALDANYMFTITETVKNQGAKPVTLYPYAAVARQGTPTPGNSKLEGALAMLDQRLDVVGYGKLANNKLAPDEQTKTSTGGWLGFSDKYWLVAAIPDQSEKITVEFRHGKNGTVDFYQTDYKGEAKTIAPGAGITETSRLFAGAKQVHLLVAYRDDLGIPKFDLAVDWGWFRFLTKPFFYGIDFLAKALGNFGLGILAFTVVVRILIFPLAYKTFREMNRMGELAPQMKELKEKHAGNRETLQTDIMELYKREKVNPISGCLPMLLQLPIFFSLYTVLSTTIEMRQQPFFWYVHDLSASDPTSVFTLFGLLPAWSIQLFGIHIPPHLGFLPLVLGCTMLGLQLSNPQPPDPLHAKMMLINPVVFTFMMASLPVGLVVYYIWSNTITMFQQRGIRRFYKWKNRHRLQAAS